MRPKRLGTKTAAALLALLFLVGCGPPTGETSLLGVLRSTDHGATWASLGNARIHDSSIGAVDPTGFVVDGRIVLYVVDITDLNDPTSQSIYRAISTDGVNFEKPRPVFTMAGKMVDPFVLRMPEGTYRLYVPVEQEQGIISAVSNDDLDFAREEGYRSMEGGMPGGIVLPDNRVRLFLCGGGIFSLISDDGLGFMPELEMRIAVEGDMVPDNPQPIRLAGGGYLMVFGRHDIGHEGQMKPWEFTEIRLATSSDGFNWTVDPEVIGYGGTCCVVEMPDGTLYVYYVNRDP
jgi:hypothetical protein